MRRGWEVELRSGIIIDESQMSWKKIPKKDIIRLTLRYDGREWNIIDKQAYFQKKTGSVIPVIKDSFVIEKRIIGWYDGVYKISYVIDEYTGMMRMEVKET